MRSSGPLDPVNSLWVLDIESGLERLIADPRQLVRRKAGRESDGEASEAGHESDGEASEAGRESDGEASEAGYESDGEESEPGSGDDLPAAEKARRERVRETGAGIVSYDADASLTTAVFTLAGRLWRVGLAVESAPELLSTRPGAFDPRLSADCRSVAYVAGSALCVVDDRGDRIVADEPADTVSWGVAEFVAAEEMGRLRGHWWSPDGRLLTARVDTAKVPRWWISEPASPDAVPSEVRYPLTGAPNADVRLAVFTLADAPEADSGGSGHQRVDVAWDGGGWEYLAAVRWNNSGLLLTVQSRDQRTLAVLRADPDTGVCTVVRQIHDDAWIELMPRVPRLYEGRLVTMEDRGLARRLCVDGDPLTSENVQIRSIHRVDETGIVVTASVDPSEVHVARVGWDGAMRWLTQEPGVHTVVANADTLVISRSSLEHCGRCITVQSPRLSAQTGRGVEIASLAEAAGLDMNVEIARLGSRRLVSALVLPSQDRGEQSLPVLLDPYGGPHVQRVQRAQALFHTSQWFADQGFAVLVIDGRGTPGRGPDFERAVRGDLAGPVLDDQISGLQAAVERWPRLDVSRVAIRGWSFGGYLAALGVLRRPDVFTAAIAGAPVTDWRLYDTHYTERYLGHPDTEPENYERCDLTPLASQLRRPLLLIHGLADDNVVAAHTLRLSRALLESARAHTVLPLSGVTHMTPQEEVAENLLLLQLRFLQDALDMNPTP